MQPAPHQQLSLSNFEMSEEHGFLPAPDPLISCSFCPDLEWLGRQLPKLLAARQLRNTINKMQDLIPRKKDDWTVDTYRYANRILSFAAHGYIWENPDHPLDLLPANLAVPWCEISRRLGRPPVLSYASYALDNWRRLDPGQPIELDNVVLLQNFLGGLDEEWFVAVHVDIEAKAGPAMGSILRAHEAVIENHADDVIAHLTALASAQEAICLTLDRMPERCDPYIYYHRVRPFIHGWKNNPALPNGIVYAGVEEYQETPQYFRGETGAQSSIIPALDAALGITHAQDPLTVYLAEMRHYMPPAHRAFLEALEGLHDHQGRPRLPGFIHDYQSRHPGLWSAYCQCVQLLARFRATHLDYAAAYIHQQSETQSSNPTSVGTGGTPFMTYLKKHLEETKPIMQ
jgi:indoleamine 2,3-dioxygenase